MTAAKVLTFSGSATIGSRDRELLAAAELGHLLRNSTRSSEAVIAFKPAWIAMLKPMMGQRALIAAVVLGQILFWFELTDPEDASSWRTKFVDEAGLPTCILSYERLADKLSVDRTTVWRVWSELERMELIVRAKIKKGNSVVACVRPNFSKVANMLKTEEALTGG